MKSAWLDEPGANDGHRQCRLRAGVQHEFDLCRRGKAALAGTDLGSVAAIDPDGGALTYSISGGPFTVSSSGDLVTTGTLNAETAPSYALTIVATTPRGLTSQEQVTVTDTASFLPVFNIGGTATFSVGEKHPGRDGFGERGGD